MIIYEKYLKIYEKYLIIYEKYLKIYDKCNTHLRPWHSQPPGQIGRDNLAQKIWPFTPAYFLVHLYIDGIYLTISHHKFMY